MSSFNNNNGASSSRSIRAVEADDITTEQDQLNLPVHLRHYATEEERTIAALNDLIGHDPTSEPQVYSKVRTNNTKNGEKPQKAGLLYPFLKSLIVSLVSPLLSIYVFYRKYERTFRRKYTVLIGVSGGVIVHSIIGVVYFYNQVVELSKTKEEFHGSFGEALNGSPQVAFLLFGAVGYFLFGLFVLVNAAFELWCYYSCGYQNISGGSGGGDRSRSRRGYQALVGEQDNDYDDEDEQNGPGIGLPSNNGHSHNA